MVKLIRFRVVFEEEAGGFIFALPKRKGRKLLDIAYAIADNPFSNSDYILPDADGRNISHVSTEGYIISYWTDAPAKRIVIVEIEEES
ncbi:hypothetical protein OpiT1DRAFT_01339 [Opitutaceae bacterium TAV1]|nr:hypothetical protein OpiT1DRAFT_01339 [Opitutaceae bacterium TAV1]